MVLVESRQPFWKNLTLSLLTSNYIGVEFSIVDTSQIINIDEAITILVKFVKSFSNNLKARLVHLSTNGTKELIILNDAIFISIESVEKHC